MQALLRVYGIDALFDDERVLDKEAGVSKSMHMERLQRRFDCAYEQITFLDDKVNHLDDVARLGVRCGLACCMRRTGSTSSRTGASSSLTRRPAA